jgi:hypothetical protein
MTQPPPAVTGEGPNGRWNESREGGARCASAPGTSRAAYATRSRTPARTGSPRASPGRRSAAARRPDAFPDAPAATAARGATTHPGNTSPRHSRRGQHVTVPFNNPNDTRSKCPSCSQEVTAPSFLLRHQHDQYRSPVRNFITMIECTVVARGTTPAVGGVRVAGGRPAQQTARDHRGLAADGAQVGPCRPAFAIGWPTYECQMTSPSPG